jgi:hypothetical protein
MTKKQIPPVELPNSSQIEREEVTKEDTKPVQDFSEGLNRILEKFKFPAETRRQIFSQLRKIKEANTNNSKKGSPK